VTVARLGLPLLLVTVLIAGCGSSSSSSESSGSSGTSSTQASTTPGSSTTSPSSTSTSGSSLKATTTPQYGTPSASSPVQSGTVKIAYRNIAIDPDLVRVKVGTTLQWTNYDSVQHNVISQGKGPQSFESKDFGEGGKFTIKAMKPGTIHYECTIHPASMNGTIEVVK
jgi:plastocyanin